jgi:hypothetical protein
MIVIDISQPTENLLWELQDVLPQFGPTCVLIGHDDEVRRLATNHAHAAARRLLAAHLASILDGWEVLAYTNDTRHEAIRANAPGQARRRSCSLNHRDI